jgi:hypothetical protein
MKCILCRKSTERSVCESCWDFALTKLKTFPAKYFELEKELLPSKGYGERVGGSKTPPIPVQLETLDLRTGGISKPITAHETKIRIVREHTRITFRGEEVNKIKMTVKYITGQSEWIFEHYEELDNLTKDINNVSNRISHVLGFRSELVPIGTCPAQDEKGQVCGAKLLINPKTLTNFDDIKCRACNTSWDSAKWRLLGRMLDADT